MTLCNMMIKELLVSAKIVPLIQYYDKVITLTGLID